LRTAMTGQLMLESHMNGATLTTWNPVHTLTYLGRTFRGQPRRPLHQPVLCLSAGFRLQHIYTRLQVIQPQPKTFMTSITHFCLVRCTYTLVKILLLCLTYSFGPKVIKKTERRRKLARVWALLTAVGM